jgi:hypothetical protein
VTPESALGSVTIVGLCATDGRDPRRSGGVGVDLREMGFAFVRQQAGRPSRPS